MIGAGASGFQLVPAIADATRQVDVYQRTPQWMAPNPMYHDAVPDGARWVIRHLPYYGQWLRFVSWPLADALDKQVRIDPDWLATRHFHEHGTTCEQLAGLATTVRANAVVNPKAALRDPMPSGIASAHG